MLSGGKREMAKSGKGIFDQMRLAEMILLGCLALVFFLGVGMDLSDQPIYEKWKAWLLAGWTIVFLACLLPAGLRCANCGVKSVWHVVGLSVFVLGVVLLVFYTCYFWAVGLSSENESRFDKLLNFPPMLAALWAAGVGWYITFQAAAKNHRTTNSFNLIMQTRTSGEFLANAKLVGLTYPHGSQVPEEDADLIDSKALKELTAEAAERAAQGLEPDPALEARLFKAKGADALKYLLNYYEFMAVGIEAKDLEEDILYNTIGVTVTSMYNRAKAFISYVRDPQRGKQPLAFTELQDLVQKWDRRLRDDASKL